tara:strand:- start:11530 stop:12069 length:540 start_codon:yes stop_codon:yes gene_type:complete
MHTISNNESTRPWFKQPWLWFVLSVPITSVILSSIMVTVAIIGKDSMVSDNYYKDGMAINQTIEQDKLANTLGLKPLLSIAGTEIKLLLKSSSKIVDQPFLTFKLLHPTVSSKDIIIKLLPSGNSLYLGELPHTIEGRRYLDLYAYDNSWRLREEITAPLIDFQLNRDTQTSANTDKLD